MPRSLARPRSLLTVGTVLVFGGLALSGTVTRTGGGVLLVAGWLLLVAGIHGFGRMGWDR